MAFKLPSLKSLLTEASSFPSSYPIDQDDDLYRKLTQSRRDLLPVEQARMIEWAWWLYQRNPLARRLIEIQKDYVLGEGVTVASDDEEINDIIQRHWNDPVNDWTVKGEQRFTDLRLFGEACWPVAETPGTGLVVLGVVDPSRIVHVLRDPLQVDEADVVVLNQPTETSVGTGAIDSSNIVGDRYKVIRHNPKTGVLEGATPEQLEAGEFKGSCFYFAINKVATAARGISDLFALIDYIDGADQFLWTQLDRAKLLNSMVWDVSVKGSGPEVQKEAERIKREGVKSGSVNVHSDSITWEALAPSLAADENKTVGSQILQWILGGVGLPEGWFGKAENSNRATLDGQADPVIKRMTSIQNHWSSVVNTVLRYQVERASARGQVKLMRPLTEAEVAKAKPGAPKERSIVDPTQPMPWKIIKPDMAVKDVSRMATAVTQIAAALAAAEQAEYISTDSARQAFLNALKLVGTELNAQEEAKKIEAQPPKSMDQYAQLPPGDPFRDEVMDWDQQQAAQDTRPGGRFGEAIARRARGRVLQNGDGRYVVTGQRVDGSLVLAPIEA